MDLAFLEFPRQFRKKDYLQLKEWTQYSVKNAAKVIAISEFTRSQVIKTYNKKPSDIILAYPALTTPPERLSAAKTETILRKLNISMPYFLYLGTLQPRKNVDQLVEAFTDAKMEDVQLIIAGKVGWLAQPLLEKIKKSPAQKSIILTGYVDDEQKRALYQGAMASFSLGSHEGFGIPALESMAVGTIPVIAKTGSLPEVVGKAGISIEEGDKAELIKTLEHLAKLKAKQRASMLKQGRDQVKNFSWKKSAETILEALESVSTS